MFQPSPEDNDIALVHYSSPDQRTGKSTFALFCKRMIFKCAVQLLQRTERCVSEEPDRHSEHSQIHRHQRLGLVSFLMFCTSARD